MLTDPRVGLWSSLGIAAAAALWLLAQWPFSESVFEALGYAAFAIDLLAIFLLLSGLAVALLFYHFHRVRQDLLAGRGVIARWHVDPEAFRRFAAVADAREDADKRGALVMVLAFLAMVFIGFAAFDPSVAGPMLTVGAAVGVAVTLAFLFGTRVRRRQLEPRSGDVVVGTDGVLVNDVLHVWRPPLSWFTGARIETGPPDILVLGYAYLTRYGAQPVEVFAPVPPEARAMAEEVVLRLAGRHARRSPSRRGRARAAG